MAEGAFREDLYFRLNVIAVEVPPLRARPNDLTRFAEHYLKYFISQCAGRASGFSPGSLEPHQCLCLAGQPARIA